MSRPVILNNLVSPLRPSTHNESEIYAKSSLNLALGADNLKQNKVPSSIGTKS